MDAKKSQRIPLLTFFGTVTLFKQSQFVFFSEIFLKSPIGPLQFFDVLAQWVFKIPEDSFF